MNKMKYKSLQKVIKINKGLEMVKTRIFAQKREEDGRERKTTQ